MNVFDFAMNIERSGSRFYRQLAEKAEQKGLKTIFTMMAKDEEELLKKFQAMKTSVRTTTREDSMALEDAPNIYKDVLDEREALSVPDDLEAYNYVMKVEEDLCRLYENAAEKENNEQVKNLLLKIAAQEHRELETLRQVYDFVNAPNEYLAWGEFSNLDEFHNFGRDED
jgi:rubrerythrin